MTSIVALKRCLSALGYRASHLIADYRFAALETERHDVRRVALAAFLDTPASYKNAAVGVVRTPEDAEDALQAEVASVRSLGAPFLVVLSPSKATAWTYSTQGPVKIKEAPADAWQTLFEASGSFLRADAVKELRSLRLRETTAKTLSLFDTSSVFALQLQAQSALDKLLKSFLECFDELGATRLSVERDFEVLFPMAFRLLSAKILEDREDAQLAGVDLDDVVAVIDKIDALYSLAPLRLRWNDAKRKQVTRAWRVLREGLFIRNVAADDLAFVYENTLISPEIRRHYGTHSTPPSVADYVIRSFNLPQDEDIRNLTVFEPFAGSCVFLTAALRRLKELLPSNWTPARTHQHLVRHFAASELDGFACEIARLALILADYPNHNGWRISREDLFADNLLTQRAKMARMVVCNPPFEDFASSPDGGLSIHKPIAALNEILAGRPQYLGIVMPPGFSSHKKYLDVADRVMKMYADVEILTLPEGTFRLATVGAEVLIAQSLKSDTGDARTALRRTEVRRQDLQRFHASLQSDLVAETREDTRTSPGLIGLQPLREVWEYLAENPKLGDIAEVHRGLEWTIDQVEASQARKERGFRRGLHRSAGSITQFRIDKPVYLDCREEHLRGGAINLPWSTQKVICTAARTSRGPWRIAAATDTEGLVVSQQFFGIWLRPEAQLTLDELTCLLNSPVLNAFSFVKDPDKRLRVGTMHDMPIPGTALDGTIKELTVAYLAQEDAAGPIFRTGDKGAADFLMEIDSYILAAYDLPPRLEREVLRLMSRGNRPCGHAFPTYPGIGAEEGALPLGVRLSATTGQDRALREALGKPLPADVANLFNY